MRYDALLAHLLLPLVVLLGAAGAVASVRRAVRLRGRVAALAGNRPGRSERWSGTLRRRWRELCGVAFPHGRAPFSFGGGRQPAAAGAGGGSVPAAWLRRRPSRPPTEDSGLPLAAELIAACLAAGASPAAAAAAVGGSLDGPLAAALERAASELRLGGEPGAAWGRVGRLPGASALARRLELADTTGIPAVSAVNAAAAEQRNRRRRRAQTAVRQAGVYITGPLGLCFLPAFFLIGVAPVVIGLAGDLL